MKNNQMMVGSSPSEDHLNSSDLNNHHTLVDHLNHIDLNDLTSAGMVDLERRMVRMDTDLASLWKDHCSSDILLNVPEAGDYILVFLSQNPSSSWSCQPVLGMNQLEQPQVDRVVQESQNRNHHTLMGEMV